MNPDTTNSSVYNNEPKFCPSCGGFVSEIFAGNPFFCRCNQPEKLERELAQKTYEASNWHQHYRDEASKAQKCKQAFIEQEKEAERLRKLMRDYIDFIDANMGTTADWPMEAAFDDETTAQRHCDLLIAMKREVKPEDIN